MSEQQAVGEQQSADSKRAGASGWRTLLAGFGPLAGRRQLLATRLLFAPRFSLLAEFIDCFQADPKYD